MYCLLKYKCNRIIFAHCMIFNFNMDKKNFVSTFEENVTPVLILKFWCPFIHEKSRQLLLNQVHMNVGMGMQTYSFRMYLHLLLKNARLLGETRCAVLPLIQPHRTASRLVNQLLEHSPEKIALLLIFMHVYF